MNEYGKATLSEIADFVFHLLGSWWEDNGFETKTRNDYTKQEPKTEFSKYHLIDGQSELSKGILKFAKEANKYNAFSQAVFAFLSFPQILQELIAEGVNDSVFCHTKKVNIQVLVSYYIGLYFVYLKTDEERNKAEDILNEICNETYAKIISSSETEFNSVDISEKSKWSTIKKLLENILATQRSEDKKKDVSEKILRHYLFLGTKAALKEVFLLSETEIQELFTNTCCYIREIYYNIISFSQNQSYSVNGVVLGSDNPLEKCSLAKCNPFGFQYRLDFGAEDCMRLAMTGDRSGLSDDDIKYLLQYVNLGEKLQQRTNLIIDAHCYYVNSYCRLSKAQTKNYERAFDSFDDELAKFTKNWYTARKIIFSIAFDDSDEDKTKIENALSLFRETFNTYKYFAGLNLREFLSDAIAADVYFNRKPLKDIIDNNQDDTDEASILKPGKSYWEFAYVTGIFDEDSKKTYLTAYNAEENFWLNFPATKFSFQESALKKFEEECVNEEILLPRFVADFSDKKKIDNLLSKENKRTRQKLGRRMYSNLSIAVMKAESKIDFENIENFIKTKDEKKLFANDECGATPLIRALERYKNLIYGFDWEYSRQYAEIISELQTAWNRPYRAIATKFEKLNISDEKIKALTSSIAENAMNVFIEKMCNLHNSKTGRTNEDYEALIKQADNLKAYVIKPLIEKNSNHITNEAICLNIRHCVSALQLAIDSYDVELVELIVEHLPSEKSNLSTLYISEDFVTPLQYAIRKYDLFMQFAENLNRKESSKSLVVHSIPRRKTVTRGILSEDKHHYRDKDFFSEIANIPDLEVGTFVKHIKPENNICFEQQKNLIEIIKYLASKTKPISVDTLYYLADQVDSTDGGVFNDVLDIARILIKDYSADVAGVDWEWERTFAATETLLAKCIRDRNYSFLSFLLTDCKKELSGVINKRIRGIGNFGKAKYETDLHMFVLNQIESTKVWLNPSYATDKRMFEKDFRDKYGKDTAFKLNHFLTLFKNAGARFDIPDQDGKTVLDYLTEWKDKFPEGSIPKEILL